GPLAGDGDDRRRKSRQPGRAVEGGCQRPGRKARRRTFADDQAAVPVARRAAQFGRSGLNAVAGMAFEPEPRSANVTAAIRNEGMLGLAFHDSCVARSLGRTDSWSGSLPVTP